MPGSRHSQRQRAVSELRAQGRYGPTFREVLPGFVGLGIAIGLPVAFLSWMYGQLGVLGLVLGVVLLAGAAVLLVRWRRALTRRRGGIYTPAELASLDDHGLAAAAERILRRDGWHVIAMPDQGRPRLYARDRSSRQLDVGFRPEGETADEDASPSPAPLREVGRPGVDNLIRVVVTRGSYSRSDVLWASRQGYVHLVDGRQLQLWAAGRSLDDLGLPG
ncbi:hypothetical protein [Streptomyces sp. MS1.AVA.4]|uniref:Uncharacterized protein n=1 Tax=Streptomyces pratisoli TaxID=3139917 RepID=A0ACC6QV67_9ACTN